MANPLTLVEKHPAIWRGSQARSPFGKRTATGFACLDKALLGGFPSSGVVRLLSQTGIGELSLLKQIFSHSQQDALYVFINPPGRMPAPALARLNVESENACEIRTSPELSFWAAEEAIKSDACSTVLLWSQSVNVKQARRLQVAASQHECLVLLLQAVTKSAVALPIPLDLKITPTAIGLNIDIQKLQGGWPQQNISIPFSYTPDNAVISKCMNRFATPFQDDALHG